MAGPQDEEAIETHGRLICWSEQAEEALAPAEQCTGHCSSCLQLVQQHFAVEKSRKKGLIENIDRSLSCACMNRQRKLEILQCSVLGVSHHACSVSSKIVLSQVGLQATTLCCGEPKDQEEIEICAIESYRFCWLVFLSIH